MRAIDLIPADAGISRRSTPPDVQAAVYAVVGVLAAAVVLSVMYVLAGNDAAQRRAELKTLRTEVAQTQARIGQLDQYVHIQQLAQQRAETVRQIAASRFDWAAAFSQLSRVVPADTTLQSLNGTVSPSTGSAPAPASPSAAAAGPSFQLAGCTGSHVEVARLISRLRLMSGVTSISLLSSAKGGSTPAGGGVPAPVPSPTTGSASTSCGPRAAQFNLTVGFSAPTSPSAATTSTMMGTAG